MRKFPGPIVLQTFEFANSGAPSYCIRSVVICHMNHSYKTPANVLEQHGPSMYTLSMLKIHLFSPFLERRDNYRLNIYNPIIIRTWQSESHSSFFLRIKYVSTNWLEGKRERYNRLRERKEGGLVRKGINLRSIYLIYLS